MTRVITKHISPNHGARPAGAVIDSVVLHADSAKGALSSVLWCCDRASKVSYHCIVERDGTVYHLVDSSRRAWHAGVSEIAGVPNVNDFSVGLAFSNRQDGTEPFTESALDAGALVVAGWMRKHPAIALERIVTHAAIARPVGRKTDPGPLFPLTDFLARVERVL